MARTRTSFKKGEGGKPKGALNRTTKQSHELFVYIMNGQVEYIEDALNKILKQVLIIIWQPGHVGITDK